VYNITGFTSDSDLLLRPTFTHCTYLLALIPHPVYNSVCFISILFVYAFDYTGLNLGLVGFGLGLTLQVSVLISHGLMVSLTSPILASPIRPHHFLQSLLSKSCKLGCCTTCCTCPSVAADIHSLPLFETIHSIRQTGSLWLVHSDDSSTAVLPRRTSKNASWPFCKPAPSTDSSLEL